MVHSGSEAENGRDLERAVWMQPRLVLRIFAIMYKPFSLKAVGLTLVFANFAVENFLRKNSSS
jgi:hypothetical protein